MASGNGVPCFIPRTYSVFQMEANLQREVILRFRCVRRLRYLSFRALLGHRPTNPNVVARYLGGRPLPNGHHTDSPLECDPKPLCNTEARLLRSAITEVNDQAIEEDRVTTDPQLNRMKRPVTTSNLNLSMILTAAYLDIAQEVPKLPPGGYGGGQG